MNQFASITVCVNYHLLIFLNINNYSLFCKKKIKSGIMKKIKKDKIILFNEVLVNFLKL